MLLKRIILIFLTFIILCRCKEQENVKTATNTITIEASNSNEVLLSKYIKEIRYIALETKQGVLINNVDKLIVNKDKIYVLDKKQDKILVFDFEGSFLFQLASKGNGVGQYASIADFTIDKKKNEIFVSDIKRGRICVYSLEGKFKRLLKAPSYCKFIETQNGYLYSYGDNMDLDYNFHCLQMKTMKINSFLPINEKLRSFHSKSSGQFMLNYNDEILFKESLSQIVYKLNKGKLNAYYQIDFKEHNVPETYFDKKSNLDDLLFDLNGGTYCAYPSVFLETNNFIHFNYICKFEKKYVFYDKTSRKAEHGDIKNDIDGLPFIESLYCDKSDIYSVLDPSVWIRIYDVLFENNKIYHSNGSNIQECFDKLTVTDNPVVVIYKDR